MNTTLHNPTDVTKKDRSDCLIDFCVETITGCKTFEQIKTAGTYCSLAIDRLYNYSGAKKEEDIIKIEGKRESIGEYFRTKLLEKAKALTPYLTEIPDEEISQILWS